MDQCPICGEYIDIICSGYSDKPFIDGKKYPQLCFTCFSIPKTWRSIENSTIYVDWEKDNLHTVQELVEEGFDKNKAQKSLKIIKSKAIGTHQCKIDHQAVPKQLFITKDELDKNGINTKE